MTYVYSKSLAGAHSLIQIMENEHHKQSCVRSAPTDIIQSQEQEKCLKFEQMAHKGFLYVPRPHYFTLAMCNPFIIVPIFVWQETRKSRIDTV